MASCLQTTEVTVRSIWAQAAESLEDQIAFVRAKGVSEASVELALRRAGFRVGSTDADVPPTGGAAPDARLSRDPQQSETANGVASRSDWLSGWWGFGFLGGSETTATASAEPTSMGPLEA